MAQLQQSAHDGAASSPALSTAAVLLMDHITQVGSKLVFVFITDDDNPEFPFGD